MAIADNLPPLIILGMPRSGTSMIAGLFSNTGAFSNQDLLPATISNPKGYFEDREVNDLNNEIIEHYLQWPLLEWRLRRKLCVIAHRDPRCFPVAAIRDLATKKLPATLRERVAEKCKDSNIVFKDPRFNSTWQAWESALPDSTRFLVVFRSPIRVIESYLRNAVEVYTPPLAISSEWVAHSYIRNYQKLLRASKGRPNWLFVNTDSPPTTRTIDAIERFTGRRTDPSTISPGIQRTSVQTAVATSSKSGRTAKAIRFYDLLIDRMIDHCFKP